MAPLVLAALLLLVGTGVILLKLKAFATLSMKRAMLSEIKLHPAESAANQLARLVKCLLTGTGFSSEESKHNARVLAELARLLPKSAPSSNEDSTPRVSLILFGGTPNPQDIVSYFSDLFSRASGRRTPVRLGPGESRYLKKLARGLENGQGLLFQNHQELLKTQSHERIGAAAS